jgi:hypothetical protein
MRKFDVQNEKTAKNIWRVIAISKVRKTLSHFPYFWRFLRFSSFFTKNQSVDFLRNVRLLAIIWRDPEFLGHGKFMKKVKNFLQIFPHF